MGVEVDDEAEDKHAGFIVESASAVKPWAAFETAESRAAKLGCSLSNITLSDLETARRHEDAAPKQASRFLLLPDRTSRAGNWDGAEA